MICLANSIVQHEISKVHDVHDMVDNDVNMCIWVVNFCYHLSPGLVSFPVMELSSLLLVGVSKSLF